MEDIYKPALIDRESHASQSDNIDFTERKKELEDAALEMVKGKISSQRTIDYLVQEGYSEEEASHTVDRLENLNRNLKIKEGQRKMVVGAIWVMLGLLISLLSFKFMNAQTSFVIAGWLILLGGFKFFKGFSLNLG